jgi:MoxR-like ATPase
MMKLKEFSPEETVLELKDAIRFVNSVVLHRKKPINQIFLALMCGEHVLIQSRTGAAKSLLARQVFSMFDTRDVFMVQASKEQQPDTYFGGLNIDELRQGRIVHNTAGSLVESDFGFIDEIFDANDYTLRSLLTTLNERMLILGIQRLPARIHSVIAATNYLRINEVTEAVLDRFLFKSVFLPEQDIPGSFEVSRVYREHQGSVAVPQSPIPFQHLKRLSTIVHGLDEQYSIEVPDDVLFFANSVVRLYETRYNRYLQENPRADGMRNETYISPRTRAKAVDVLRAIALLNGHTKVEREDVGQLWYYFTTVGMREQEDLFVKCHTQTYQQFTATHAFDQIDMMIGIMDLIAMLKNDRSLLSVPITSLEKIPMKRSLMEWAKEKFGLADPGVEYNHRLLDGYIRSISPATEELQELKSHLERDVMKLFKDDGTVLQ